MAYTKEGIMAQLWVAFGQGTGALRVSQDAAVALQDLYYGSIADDLVNGEWEKEGVQVLERIRAIGRLAAHTAASRGDTKVSAADVRGSAFTVQLTSDTERCPPDTGG